MTDIYLVRHCESMANHTFCFAGRTDVDISAKGEIQLKCLKNYFKNIHLDKVYTSPLIRARKTAMAINAYSNAPIIAQQDFIEMNFGVLDGRPVKELSEKQVHYWKEEPDLFTVCGGETMREVAKRAFSALARVVKENDGKTIAIASHGGVIRNIIRVLMKLDPSEINKVDWCDNTGVNRIIYDNNEFKIVYLNDTSHLTEDAEAVPVTKWQEE